MALGTTLAGVSELGVLVLDFLGDVVGYLLFSGVEGDSVKSHAEQPSRQTEQKLCDLCWGKMGSGDWKSSKTEQRLPLEVGIESNEATARDMGTRLRRRSDANSEQRRLECPLWREQERLGLMSGELGMEEPKTRLGVGLNSIPSCCPRAPACIIPASCPKHRHGSACGWDWTGSQFGLQVFLLP